MSATVRVTGPVGLAAALATALIAASVAPLGATVVAPADLSEVVRSSQIVVHGRVADVRPFETAGRSTIESLVTLEVLDTLKGPPGATVFFKVPGGQVGRYRRIMVGVPAFDVGDEVVVFLTGRPPAVPMPFGLSQGVYRVQRDAAGRATVSPLPAEGQGRVVRGDPARRPVELGAFAERVRALAGERP